MIDGYSWESPNSEFTHLRHFDMEEWWRMSTMSQSSCVSRRSSAVAVAALAWRSCSRQKGSLPRFRVISGSLAAQERVHCKFKSCWRSHVEGSVQTFGPKIVQSHLSCVIECHYHDETRSFFHPSHLLHHGIWFNIDLWFSSNKRPGRCVFFGYTNACADSAECRCVRPSRCGDSAARDSPTVMRWLLHGWGQWKPWTPCTPWTPRPSQGNPSFFGHFFSNFWIAFTVFLGRFLSLLALLKVQHQIGKLGRLAIGCLSLQENLGKACLPFHQPPRGALVES